MGGTDTGKQDIADKPTPPLPPTPTSPVVEDGASESSSIPQMVVTPPDGLNEDSEGKEAAEGSTSSQSVLQRPLALGSASPLSETTIDSKDDGRETEDLHSVIQRPLVINPSAVITTTEDGGYKKEGDLQIFIQRPLILGSSEAVEKEVSQQEKKETEDLQSVAQRPLVVSSESASPVAEKEGLLEDKEAEKTVIQRPLLVSSVSGATPIDSETVQLDKIDKEELPSTIQRPLVISSAAILAEDEVIEHDRIESEKLQQKSLTIKSEDITPTTTELHDLQTEVTGEKVTSETEQKEPACDDSKQKVDESCAQDAPSTPSPKHPEGGDASSPSEQPESPVGTQKSRVFSWVTDSKSVFNLCKHTRSPKEKKDPEAVDSSDEACCSRLAALLRNKAVELVSSHTSHKPTPPPKPPKPSAEAIARARAARLASENRPKSFGDDLPVGVDGLRYVDDETESSTDYKDVTENMAFMIECPFFEAYGMQQVTYSQVQPIRDHSVVSEDSSYHTADTVTLKNDGNMSDNTLDSISLGSDDSWVAKPLSLTPTDKESHLPLSSLSDKKPGSDASKMGPSNLLAQKHDSAHLSFTTSSEKSASGKSLQKGVTKREKPPIPPKPAILMKPLRKEGSSSPSRLMARIEESRHLKGLSLSPRLQHKDLENTKQRPLRVSSIKRTVFPDRLRTKDSQQKVASRPLSVTLGKETNLETEISPPLSPTSKVPPVRPPPPDLSKLRAAKLESSPSVCSSSPGTTLPASTSVLTSTENAITVPPVPPPKPLRLTSPVSQFAPPRPPPPAPRPRSKTVPGAGIKVSSPKIVAESPFKIEDTPIAEGLSSTSTPDLSESSHHADSPSSVIYVEKKAVDSSALPDEDLERISPVISPSVLPVEEVKSDSISSDHLSQSPSFTSTPVPYEEATGLIHTPVCAETEEKHVPDTVQLDESVASTSPFPDAPEVVKEESKEPLPPPRSAHRRPKPPPRVRRNRSRTVEVTSVTTRPEVPKCRSRSLTESDVRKRLEARQLDSQGVKPEMKVLYTSIQKDPAKNKQKNDEEIDVDETVDPEKIKSRPLPPPPPPPRSRSKSSSLNREKKERVESMAESGVQESSEKKKDKKPKKSERRRSNETPPGSMKTRSKPKDQDATRDSDHVKSSCDRILSENDRPSPESKIMKEIEVDENANVAEPLPSDDIQGSQYSGEKRLSQSIFYCDDITPSESSQKSDRKSPSPSHSHKSTSPGRKSHASWYDESDVSGDLGDVDTSVSSSQKASTEKLDSLPESEPKEALSSSPSQHKSKQSKSRGDTPKKQRMSTFYCDADDEAATNVEKKPEREEVKEPSPVLLERAEKSVQTSLETLGRGTVSGGEQSDDTDELLNIAQNLQKELKVILQRHRTTGDTTSEEDAPEERDQEFEFAKKSAYGSLAPVLTSREESKSFISNRSSISEASLQTSSEESEEEPSEQTSLTPEEATELKKKKKAYYVAKEIMSSEEVFVDALRLMNQDFRTAVEKALEQSGSAFPEEIVNQILRHHPQLQNLNEKLLEELKERVQNWETEPRIADVIVKIGPFLKLYSWYIRDFETMTSTLDEACKKYPGFAQLVKEFEMSPRCQKLQISHYLLKPVQRIPQYRLLLQQYLQHLPIESPDYPDTQAALEIVSQVADHANEAMKEGDNFEKLLSIQNSITGNKEIIQPGRIFIKEGELMKLSRKGLQPRWFVLLSDLLLYMTPLQQGMYRMNHELPLTGMRVDIPVQQDYQNEFSVISTTRSFSLAARSPEERSQWIEALTRAIARNASKRSTFTNTRIQQDGHQVSPSESFILGKQAPVWIPDARVTMCQLCTTEFTVTFRRHHCRACGKVVCSQCSANKAPLQYRRYKAERVCDECFVKLMKELEAEGKNVEEAESGTGGTETGDTDSDTFQKASLISQFKGNAKAGGKKIKRHVPKVLKEVCANDQGSTISGYLQKRGRHKGWKRYWFVIKDKVLYTYKASEDILALESIPLLGFKVETFQESFEGVEPHLLFRLSHAGRPPITFHTESSSAAERWILAMQDATVLE